MARLSLAVHAALALAASAGSCVGTTYDFFLLETQWDITECMDQYKCNSTNDKFFTLHGLWPQLADGNYPCDCTNEAFNANEVAPIRSQLNTYWPSLNGPNPTFWSHEWSKHGTCATVFNSQLAFFNGTLALRSRFDAVSALAKAGIVPSNTKGFSLQAFKTALQRAYGIDSVVQCDSSGNIQEVSQCLSASLAPTVKCPGIVTDNCNAKTLYLPASL